MEEGFELLEEKVRKAADLVKRLRKANQDLEEERARLGTRVKEAERRLEALEKGHGSAEEGRRREAVDEELGALRREREEIRRRLARLLEVLDGLE